MTFDLKTTPSVRAASEAGYTFELKSPPDDAPTGVFITVRGPESEALRALLGRQVQREASREVIAKKRGREPEPRSIEDREAEFIELAVAATLDWSGFADDGRPLPCTADNAARVYADHSWIRAQVVREALELGNFVRSSSASSASTRAPNSP